MDGLPSRVQMLLSRMIAKSNAQKKVAPRKGCVDTIYNDINRGFYDIPRKPFFPPIFTKTKLLLGVLFFRKRFKIHSGRF